MEQKQGTNIVGDLAKAAALRSTLLLVTANVIAILELQQPSARTIMKTTKKCSVGISPRQPFHVVAKLFSYQRTRNFQQHSHGCRHLVLRRASFFGKLISLVSLSLEKN